MKKIITILVLIFSLQNMIEPPQASAQTSITDNMIMQKIIKDTYNKVSLSSGKAPIKQNVLDVLNLYAKSLTSNENYGFSVELLNERDQLNIDCNAIENSKYPLVISRNMIHDNDEFHQKIVNEIVLLIFEKAYYEKNKELPCNKDFHLKVKDAVAAL